MTNLSITKGVDNATPNVGEDVVFTLTVSNAGPSDATGVVVTDQLPSGYSYVSDDGSGAYVSGTGVWTIGAIANGGTSVLNITATVLATGSYGNTATITSSNETDPDPSDDDDTNTPVVNVPPVANDDTGNRTTQDTPITVNTVGGNDSDSDGTIDPSTIILIDPSNPSNTGSVGSPLVISGVGTYAVDASGNVTFTPEPSFTGAADIYYTIEDNDGAVSNEATIGIVVNAPPVANDDTGNSTSEDTPITINAIGGNDSDPDGTVDPSTIILIDPSNPSNTGSVGAPLIIPGIGIYSVDASGNVTFTPELDFNGTADINYTIEDNDGSVSNEGTIEILVDPVNDPPVVSDDSYNILSTDVLNSTITGLVSDPDGDDLTFDLIQDVSDGTLVFNPDGSYTYTPPVGFSGTTTFEIEVCDDGIPILCETLTVTIQVTVGDSDGDGIPDDEEDRNGDGDYENDDCDADGVPDYLDPDVCPGLKTQKVITPNGDGINDFMKITDIDQYPNNRVVIFNRWGNKVWEVNGYNNLTSSKRFEGNSNTKNGGPLPDGTYFYVIDPGDGSAPIKNFVVIKN